ncbi:MAG: MnhB domain-containing protein [Planctomycetota bacterium]
MKGMTVIVKTIASWVKVLIFLFGIYIVLFGHLTPGGGFAGGVILAGSYVLLLLAFGREFTEKNLSLKTASKLDCGGALLFVAVALTGFLYGSAGFFYNFIQQEYLAGHNTAFKLVSAGIIPLENIAIGLKVGASLFLIVLLLSVFRPESSGKEKE